MSKDDDKRQSFDDKYRRHPRTLNDEGIEHSDSFDSTEDSYTEERETKEPVNNKADNNHLNHHNQPTKEKRSGAGSFFMALFAGILGALLVLVLYHFIFNNNQSVDVGQNNENVEEVRDNLEKDNDDKDITDATVAVEKARPAVVSVINLQQQQSLFGEALDEDLEEAGSGSGVVYKLDDDDAYVVTNNHVIENANGVRVNLDNGDSIEAEVLGTDVWTDLAVLKMDRGDIDDVIEFGDSDDLLVGEETIAIGSPLGDMFSGSVSRGIVSALDRAVPVDVSGDGTIDWEANVIQTDAAINPGNSGGALVNSDGELIGINSMKIGLENVEGIGFAIPSNEVADIISELESDGEVSRPFMGVSLMDLYMLTPEVLQDELQLPEDVTKGVLVGQVESGSPADEADIPERAVIVSLDGNEVDNAMEFRQYLYGEKEPGDTIEVEYYDSGEKETVTVQL